MRNKKFSRNFHSILSITLSLVMLLGACFVVPVTTASAEGSDVITIDFETQTANYSGTTLLGIDEMAREGVEGTKVFRASSSNQKRSQLIKDKDGNVYSLSAGAYRVSYEYMVPDTSHSTYDVYLVHNVLKTTGVLENNVTQNYASGEYISKTGLITDKTQANVWLEGSIIITVENDVTDIGFAAYTNGDSSNWYPVYLDNVVFTKINAESAYAEDHNTFTTFSGTQTSYGTLDTISTNSAFYHNTQFNSHTRPETAGDDAGNSTLAVALWSSARHFKLNDSFNPLQLRASTTYSVTFKWLNPNPESADGTVNNTSIYDGSTGYNTSAYISLISGAGAMNATSYTTLATLLNVNDFSSAEGNTGEWVTKTVTFYVDSETDLTDIALSVKNSNGLVYSTHSQANAEAGCILIDDVKFTAEDCLYIDFENHDKTGSGYFAVEAVDDRNGASTKAWSVYGTTTADARYASVKNNVTGGYYSLPKGIYDIEYWWYCPTDATNLSAAATVKFADVPTSESPYAKGTTYGSNLVSATCNTGVWTKETVRLNFTSGITRLGFYTYKAPNKFYIDDVKVTKLDVAQFTYSDGTVEYKDYSDTLTLPEDSAINFSHWVDSAGNVCNVGDTATSGEVYTAVLDNHYIFTAENFKDTEKAVKTTEDEDTFIRVTLPEDEYISVPLNATVNGADKVFRVEAGKTYLARATYRSDSAGTASTKYSEALFVLGSESNKGGVALSDTAEWRTSGWAYVKAASANGEADVSLSISNRGATLNTVDILSVELVAFNKADYKPTTQVEMFYNASEEECDVTGNNLTGFEGVKMPALSAVYTKDDTQRSMLRFVSTYIDDTTHRIEIADNVYVSIKARRLILGKSTYSLNSSGIIDTNSRVGASAEAMPNTYWRRDAENGTLSYSLALKNISVNKASYSYTAQPYLRLSVIDGTSYHSWSAESFGFNDLLITGDVITASAQECYDALVAQNPEITGWYTTDTVTE